MPLNETDKGWVRDYVRTFNQRQGWGKLTGFVKDWSGAGGVIAIILFALVQWNGYTEFKTRAGLRLDGIDGRLEKIDNSLLELRASQFPDTVLHEINGLEQVKFANALPALHTAVQKPEAISKVSQPVLDGIAEKLSKTNPSAPDYWPTVLQFLHFATAGLSSASVPAPGRPPVLTSSQGRPSLTTISPV